MAVDFTTLRSRQRQKTTARSSRTCREHGKTEAASLRPGMRFRLVPRAFAALHSLPSECTRRPRHAPTCGPAHHSHSAAGKSRQYSSSSKPADASQTLPATSPPDSHSTESNAALHPHPPQKRHSAQRFCANSQALVIFPYGFEGRESRSITMLLNFGRSKSVCTCTNRSPSPG